MSYIENNKENIIDYDMIEQEDDSIRNIDNSINELNISSEAKNAIADHILIKEKAYEQLNKITPPNINKNYENLNNNYTNVN